jgi:DinB superfamily
MMKASLERFRSIRARTLDLAQGLSQEQMDFSPAADAWSIGEILDHLRLNEHVFHTDIAALIDLVKAGKAPRLYRSFADFNAAPAFIPKWALPCLEVPFTVINIFLPNSLRETLVQSNLVSIRHPDITTPRKGRPADVLRSELRASLQETETLLCGQSHPRLRHDDAPAPAVRYPNGASIS